MLRSAMEMMKNPQMMEQMKHMMQDPAVKERMKRMLAKLGPDTNITGAEGVAAGDDDAMNQMWERMQVALADPAMLEKLSAAASSEKFQHRMQQLASDPTFANAAGDYVSEMQQEVCATRRRFPPAAPPRPFPTDSEQSRAVLQESRARARTHVVALQGSRSAVPRCRGREILRTDASCGPSLQIVAELGAESDDQLSMDADEEAEGVKEEE